MEMFSAANTGARHRNNASIERRPLLREEEEEEKEEESMENKKKKEKSAKTIKFSGAEEGEEEKKKAFRNLRHHQNNLLSHSEAENSSPLLLADGGGNVVVTAMGAAAMDLEKNSSLKFGSSPRKTKKSAGGEHFPHTAEDLLAHEANFGAYGGSAQLGFYYPEKGGEEEEEFEEDEGKQKGAVVFAGRQSLLGRPFRWIVRMKRELKDDFGSIFLLLLLYMLQGVPLGLIAAIPLLLQSKGITLAQQAVFSFAYYPFSMKLLWAPIVDSVYFKRIGRRKSWMVPCQYLIGIFLLVVSYHVPEIMGTEDKNAKPNIVFLTCVFLPLNFLAATQDIAVDGWALTMLSRKNVGYASTCNVVGQTIGVFLGNVVFLALQSKEFANRFRAVAESKGFVELDGFVFFWGIVFLVTTTLVLIFKHEIDHSLAQNQPAGSAEIDRKGSGSDEEKEEGEEELELGIKDTYVVLFKILCLKPMLVMIVVLLTGKIAFAASDGMTDLKLLDAGMTTDTIASRSVLLTPLHIILPWLLGKQTAGPKPLNVFLWAYPYRLAMGVAFALLVYFTPTFRDPNGGFSYFYYVIWIAGYYLQQVSSYCIFLSMMAFNAQISDPKIGGTYMTLLNTLNNLGGNWPVTFFLSITEKFNRRNCISIATKQVLNTCHSKEAADLCESKHDAKCEFSIDGYYISVAICTVVGLLWFRVFYRRIKYFQKIPRQEWRVIKNK